MEEHTAWSLGPWPGDSFGERGITNKNQARLAIPHHAGEFSRRLPRIERHNDDSLGHERQMESRPANGIGRKKGATFPGLDAGASNEHADELDLVQQFPARHTQQPIPANFAKNDAAIRALQLGKNRLKKIGHEESANCGERGRRRGVTLREPKQDFSPRAQKLYLPPRALRPLSRPPPPPQPPTPRNSRKNEGAVRDIRWGRIVQKKMGNEKSANGGGGGGQRV